MSIVRLIVVNVLVSVAIVAAGHAYFYYFG